MHKAKKQHKNWALFIVLGSLSWIFLAINNVAFFIFPRLSTTANRSVCFIFALRLKLNLAGNRKFQIQTQITGIFFQRVADIPIWILRLYQ